MKGIQNFKAGVQFQHTLLSEDFNFGITDPTFNVPGTPGYDPGLLAYDLTRGGSLFLFNGHADIRQEAIYAQDAISIKNWTFNLGVRGDNYDGLSHGHLLQPRLGAAYNIKKTNTVLRASYGRFFETPYNENLVISSSTGPGGLASSGLAGFGSFPIEPGHRSQYNVGLQQAAGRWASIDLEYFWKFTKNDFDFDTLFNTPLTFPIEWKQSKIDGFSGRITFPTYHGFTAYTVLSHSRARFFPPEVGGILFNSPLDTSPFRIDHDQAFGASTNLQYQPKKNSPWMSFTWRYDSGEVAGAITSLEDALTLSNNPFVLGDEQAQMGLACGGVAATPTAPITTCPSGQLSATRVRVPAPGTYNADTNPARIAPRNIFDMGFGWDNVLRKDRYKTNLNFTVANLTNTESLYNFLSTFSGTHFIPPRTYTGEVSLHF